MVDHTVHGAMIIPPRQRQCRRRHNKQTCAQGGPNADFHGISSPCWGRSRLQNRCCRRIAIPHKPERRRDRTV